MRISKEKNNNTSNNEWLDGGADCYWLYWSSLWCTKGRPKSLARLMDEVERCGCHQTATCVRVALRAGHWNRYGAHSNWICQNLLPVNVEPLLRKAAAHDLQLSKYDQWLYLSFCCCCLYCLCCWWRWWWWLYFIILFKFIVLIGCCDIETNYIHRVHRDLKYDGDDWIILQSDTMCTPYQRQRVRIICQRAWQSARI